MVEQPLRTITGSDIVFAYYNGQYVMICVIDRTILS